MKTTIRNGKEMIRNLYLFSTNQDQPERLVGDNQDDLFDVERDDEIHNET